MKGLFLKTDRGHRVFAKYAKGESPVSVVFIHGIGSNLTQWKALQERLLRKGFESISLDLPGSGMSEKLPGKEDYTMQSLADDVSSVVRQITKKPVVLVGHSMGAMICLDISFRKLLKVKGIVLIEPVYKNPFEQLKLGRGTEHLAEALADFFSRHVRSHRCIETDMNRIGKNRLSYIISSLITMPLSIEVECISNMSKYDWKKAVKEIKVPVRIIAGEKDEFAKVGSLGELIAGLKNCSLKIVRNGRHTMIVEETGKVGKLVEEAVEEIIS